MILSSSSRHQRHAGRSRTAPIRSIRLSDKWRELYGQRIERMVAPFKLAHIPVAWVGLPPMRSERFNAQVIKLNELYKEHAEKAGAQYIDIWDAFADEGGQYNAYGPDINGQNAKLRIGRRHPFHQGRRAQDGAIPGDATSSGRSMRPSRRTTSPTCRPTSNRRRSTSTRKSAAKWASRGAAARRRREPSSRQSLLAGPIEPLTARPLVARRRARHAPIRAARRRRDVERVLADGAPIDAETRPRRRFFLAAALTSRSRSAIG